MQSPDDSFDVMARKLSLDSKAAEEGAAEKTIEDQVGEGQKGETVVGPHSLPEEGEKEGLPGSSNTGALPSAVDEEGCVDQEDPAN